MDFLTYLPGTMFIALTDSNLPYTAFNLSNVNPHVAAGPFLYQAGETIRLPSLSKKMSCIVRARGAGKSIFA
jgi:hypothetical protein